MSRTSSSSSFSRAMTPAFASPQYRSVCDDYRVSRVQLASQVHKAIRDGDYAWLPELVACGEDGTDDNDDDATRTSRAADVLWEANSSGWTALHYAASHFLPMEWWRWILERAVGGPDSNHNQSKADDGKGGYPERFQTVRNDLGETVVDIFFRSFLAPLPWQSKQVKRGSQRLLQAMQTVCENPTLLHQTRTILEQQEPETKDDQEEMASSSFATTRLRRETHWYDLPSATAIRRRGEDQQSINHDENDSVTLSDDLAVTYCVGFCRNLQLLCQVAETGRVYASSLSSSSLKGNHHYPFPRVILFLAQTGGCPESFAQLAFALFPEQAQETISIASPSHSFPVDPRQPTITTSYPLHVWCASRNAHAKAMHGIQQPLLRAFPAAAWTVDSMGRYPMHHALASGNKSWYDVAPLFAAAPFVVTCRDPVTHLFPMALLALPRATTCRSPLQTREEEDYKKKPIHDDRTGTSVNSLAETEQVDHEAIAIRARQTSAGEKGLVSLWYIMPMASRQEALQRAAREMECEQVTSIFLALQAYPQALPCSYIKPGS